MRITEAQARPVPRTRRASHATRARRPPRKLYIGPLLVLSFFIIESLLLLRIAGQATSQDPRSNPFQAVLFMTDLLVAPFRGFASEYSAKETGIIEFSTLLAFEAYLVLGLVLIFLVQLVRGIALLRRRSQRRRLQQRPALSVVPSAAATAAAQASDSRAA